MNRSFGLYFQINSRGLTIGSGLDFHFETMLGKNFTKYYKLFNCKLSTVYLPDFVDTAVSTHPLMCKLLCVDHAIITCVKCYVVLIM